ncbi:cytochrome P450 [Nocardia abscessus]|uniref:cytochrome P450 n=1 Tax=Nocardia TaxID=1817 RepID=UPI0018941DEA|nr:cytochrome P450 [Nocardia abscessus]MBF6207384.1 cytochrome P450 [Streptomyces gardneri]MBF6472421.1 cytochrome P450 [Nocardia abscessus]
MTAVHAEGRPDIPAELVFDYDMYWDDRIAADPHEGWLALRAETPDVFYTPRNGGHWVAVGTDAITAILRTPSTFSNSNQLIPKRDAMPRMIPESLDPPEHLLYRRLMMTYFEPKAIAHLRTQAEQMVDSLIAEVRDKGECEFVWSIARPMPVKVFMQFVGFPLERFEDFVGMIDAYFGGRTPETAAPILAAIDDLIEEKKRHDTGDIFSRLVRAEFQGRLLTHEELQSMGFLLFLAGLDTVTTGMAYGIRHLARFPEHQEELRRSPELIPNAVEELLRAYTYTSVPRLITQDVELCGAPMKAGDMVLPLLAFVGRDGSLNERPDQVDFHREKRTHFAFGSGGHTCLGRHLAKLELNVLYERWLAQMPTFRLDESKQVGRVRGGSVTEMPHVWLTWQPQ